VPEGEGGED